MISVRQSAASAYVNYCPHTLKLYLAGVQGMDKDCMERGREEHAKLEAMVKAGITPDCIAPIMTAWGIGLPTPERQYHYTFGGIDFFGTVDLSLTSERALYIIDYKFPVVEYNIRNYESKGLQLMIYAYLCARELNIEPEAICAAFVFPEFSTPENVKWIPFTDWTWQEIKEKVEAVFADIVGAVGTGQYPPNFLNCKQCLYCDNCPARMEQTRDLILPEPGEITAANIGEVYKRCKLARALAEQANRCEDAIKELMQAIPEFQVDNTIVRLKQQAGKRKLNQADTLLALLKNYSPDELVREMTLSLKAAENLCKKIGLDVNQFAAPGEPEYRFSETKIAEVESDNNENKF